MIVKKVKELIYPDKPFVHSPAQDEAARILADPRYKYCRLVGGARSGKSLGIAEYQVLIALLFPGSRQAAIRGTYSSARSSLGLDTFPSLLAKAFPNVPFKLSATDCTLTINLTGTPSYVHILGCEAERIEAILGREFCSIWLNECTAFQWPKVKRILTRLAQKIPGVTNKLIVDLNPIGQSHFSHQLWDLHRDPETKEPLPNPEEYASCKLNPQDNAANIDPGILKILENLKGRERERFWLGNYQADNEKALFKPHFFDGNKVIPHHDEFDRITIAIDPAGSTHKSSDETGISVVGTRAVEGVKHYYLIKDASGRYTPQQWVKTALALFNDYKADRIVAETNFGGDMVKEMLRQNAPNLPFRPVRASRGKTIRALPVADLAEAGRIHIADETVIEQLCNIDIENNVHDDRADAFIWAVTDLMEGGKATGTVSEWQF